MSLFDYECNCRQIAWSPTVETPHSPLCPRGKMIGVPCPTCGRACCTLVYPSNGGYMVIDGCSEFCETVPNADRRAFRAGLEKGAFTVWPCQECGCAVEDEWPGAEAEHCCSDCYHRIRARIRRQLLERALRYLDQHFSRHAAELADEIGKELKR